MKLTTFNNRDGTVGAHIQYEYGGIDHLLKSTPSNGISVMWGAATQDEFLHYTTRRKIHPSASVIINRSPVYYYHFGQKTGLYAKRKYKIESFLQKDAPNFFARENGDKYDLIDTIEYATTVDQGEFESFVEYLYVSTRRVKDGASQEIRSTFSAAKKFEYSGPVIINIRPYFTFMDLIVMWNWANSEKRSGPLIVCASRFDNGWIKSSIVTHALEAEYIPRDELIDCVQSHYQMSEQTVQTAFRIWKNSLDSGSRKLAEDGKITKQMAARFAAAVADSTFEDERSKEPQVPAQRPAPLRFKSEGSLLDILASREYAPDEARVRGSAKTCLVTAGDMSEYGGFSNTIPGFSNKIYRITETLKLVESGSYDDTLIVQLGTEVSALELRIWAAKEQLGEIAFQEASVFFATSYSLLAQFSAWNEYKKFVDKSLSDRDDKAFLAAKDVLRDAAASEGVATDGAKERIGDYISGIDTSNGPPAQREGAILSAENAASQVATQIVEAAKREGVEIGKEFGKQLREKSASGAAAWFVENISKLNTLATAKNIQWLLSFIQRFADQ